MDATERELLRATVDGAVSGTADADAALTELGWREMLATEPRDAVEIVFGALGRANADATVLDDVLAVALGTEPRDGLAVQLPAFGAWAPPGTAGLATARATTATELLVVGDEPPSITTVSIAAAHVQPVRGIDPDARLHAVTIDRGELASASALDQDAWDSAVAAGQRAVARQMAGASRAMLDMACAHAVERVQFGRPVSRFQAVRHRLADALVAVEALEACIDAAWDAPGPETAALAKAAAGRTARAVAAHTQQVLAGIGFTTDHPFHRYLKRTLALEGVFGSVDDIVVAVGRQLLATRRAPSLIDL
jgi:hypothetical protein